VSQEQTNPFPPAFLSAWDSRRSVSSAIFCPLICAGTYLDESPGDGDARRCDGELGTRTRRSTPRKRTKVRRSLVTRIDLVSSSLSSSSPFLSDAGFPLPPPPALTTSSERVNQRRQMTTPSPSALESSPKMEWFLCELLLNEEQTTAGPGYCLPP
jgi:hypothetical protein